MIAGWQPCGSREPGIGCLRAHGFFIGHNFSTVLKQLLIFGYYYGEYRVTENPITGYILGGNHVEAENTTHHRPGR